MVKTIGEYDTCLPKSLKPFNFHEKSALQVNNKATGISSKVLVFQDRLW